MIDYFNNNQAQFWFLVGFALLALEVVAFGLATGVLLFGSLGALVTGALFWFDLLPANWLAGIAAFSITSVVLAVVLWKPLKSLQSGSELGSDQSSDLIGHEFKLKGAITMSVPGNVRYSGIDWRVEIDDAAVVEQIDKGARVRVNRVNAGVFRVLPV